MGKDKFLWYMAFIVVLLFSCSEKQIKEVNDLISVSEIALSLEQADQIESAKRTLIANRERLTRGEYVGNINIGGFLNVEQLGKLSFTTIPYCELDTALFWSDFNHENLKDYIKITPDKSMYLGKVDGQYAIMMNLKSQNNGAWVQDFCLEGIDYFRRVFSWIPQSLKQSGKKEFYILNALGRNYIVYKEEDGSVFCNFTGNIRMNELSFFKSLVSRKNLIDEGEQFFKDWMKPENFEKIPVTGRKLREYIKKNILSDVSLIFYDSYLESV